jgi:putative phage-type endonuclease
MEDTTKMTATAQVHPRVRALLARPQYVQRSPEWYEVRKGLMTASDAAGALGIPAWTGQRNVRENLLKQKVSGTFTGNHMTRHGQAYEDVVRDRFADILGVRCYDVGLLVHEKYPWLGASPDGVTDSGALIEIKCPYKRQPIAGHPPHHYIPQMQTQLEVANLDYCYFVQWMPDWLSPDGKEIFTIDIIERDPEWFAQHVDALHAFWKDLMAARAAYVPPPPPECLVDLDLYAA